MPYFDDGPPPRDLEKENALELLEIYRVRNAKLKAENDDLRRQVYALTNPRVTGKVKS